MMDDKLFAEVFNEVITKCENTLIAKGAEYSPGKDKLHNFRQAAALEQCTTRQALGGFLTKHIVSIFDMIHEPKSRPVEVWDEKLGDAINYLILLKAVVVDEKLGEQNYTDGMIGFAPDPVDKMFHQTNTIEKDANA